MSRRQFTATAGDDRIGQIVRCALFCPTERTVGGTKLG